MSVAGRVVFFLYIAQALIGLLVGFTLPWVQLLMKQ
jgi:hypothetical protein